MILPWCKRLPASVQVCGTEYEIRSDYRVILDICAALSDAELSEKEKALVALDIFYPDFSVMPQEHYQGAMQQCFEFINCGDQQQSRPAPKLIDWEQDFKYIVAPINRIMGQEIRTMEYLHWWTFIAAYYEIGECLLAQIVRIRNKKTRGKPLDKFDREWYQQNRELVDMQTSYTSRENELLDMWMGKKESAP